MIESPTKDECFKCCEWFTNRNPVRKLPYTVIGYDDDLNIIYLSYCQKCRAGDPKPHYEHED